DLPAPRTGGRALDLPAPKAKAPAAARPAPDLGAPIIDLPTPKNTLGDLPMPRAGGHAGHIDLPTPKPGQLGDLPMPKPGQASDLPTPKHPGGGFADLPMPKPGQMTDLPMPKPGGAGDLPAPKGFFHDLPQPATNQGPGLPAPKGFFDDLPAKPNKPAAGKPELPAPKGFFDDLPGRPNQAKPEVPAPKGFFDDLPGRAHQGGGGSDVPAPKGFFDDLPGRPHQAKPEVPAPKGFFDDLPGRVNPAKPEVPAPKGFFEDLPRPADGHHGAEPIELDGGALELDGGGLELAPSDSAAPASSSASQFDALDLAAPTAPPPPPAMGASAGLRITTPSRPANQISNPYSGTAERGVHGTFPPTNVGQEPVLELEEPRPKATPKLGARREAAPRFDPVASSRRRKRLLVGVLIGALVLGIGAGGFVYMQRRAEKQEKQQTIDAQLAAARAAIAAGDFDKAGNAIKKITELEEDDADGVARGLGAEAAFASHLAKGTSGALGKGRTHLTKAREANLESPELERARALQSLAQNQPEQGLPKLIQLSSAAPKDGVLLLYVAWGAALKGTYADAIKAFDAAAGASPQLKLYALYGRGRANLALGKIAEARGDFNEILKLKEGESHVGAMVGLAEALPASQNQERENEALAILERKDLANADQRAVAAAWVLAADAARASGRFDIARERYRKALAIDGNDVVALTGLAETELRDGKLDTASEMITRATTIAKDNIRAQLVAAEIEIRQKRLDVAQQRIQILAERNPPPPVAEQAQLKLINGKLLEAQGEDALAADMYVAAAKLAGERDLTPTLLAVGKLSELASKDPSKAAEYREIADQLLGKLATEAAKDPKLALTLGISYLQAGDPEKAEPWLKGVAEVRTSDAEAQYYYGKALAARSKFDEAIEHLKKATTLDDKRVEFGLELARTYETAGKDADAEAQYSTLLEGKDLPLELRARACRFYARTGDPKKAGEQGTKITEKDAQHPAGTFCKAEGLLATGRTDDARKLFSQAADADKDPQFFDGLGRAAEKQATESGDARFQEQALRSYDEALKLQPTMRNPAVGKARLYVARHEDAKAVAALTDTYKAFPDDGEISYLFGISYRALSKTGGKNEVDAAIRWLELSLTQQPRGDAAFALGELHFDLAQGAQAAKAFAQAVAIANAELKKTGKDSPWLTDALYYLGRVNLDLHNEAAARRAWEEYLGRKPPSGPRVDEVRRILNTTLRGG
ncbi:MAG: tetratricopeptide repeat protein, partial [Deltaproteobacteria bacterium]|nr:tetratricopeptide repeat protein [Deltaproteobacteria bacterium]